MRDKIIVIDNFYNNPTEYRNFALSQEFRVSENYSGYRTKPFANSIVKECFERILNKRIINFKTTNDQCNGSFQKTIEEINLQIHQDETDWSGIVYLTHDVLLSSGIAFYRHKETGIEEVNVNTSDEIKRRLDEDLYDMSKWEMIDNVGNKFNRLILFRGTRFHRIIKYCPSENSKENDDLFQLFFFNEDKNILNFFNYEKDRLTSQISLYRSQVLMLKTESSSGSQSSISISTSTTSSAEIPKIIHQMWIGPKPRPSNFMETWKAKHPDYEYILWDEEEIIKRNIIFECQKQIDEMAEICGKVDIMRWEILYHYGGIFLDADSICIEPLNYLVEQNRSFVGYENEIRLPGSIANGTLAFTRNHPLCLSAINIIKKSNLVNKRAWLTVGPVLLTQLIDSKNYDDVVVYPSYYFLPEHQSKIKYEKHGKIYAYQAWGSTFDIYDELINVKLPTEYTKPSDYVSILISSYNTKHEYILECLDSIKDQVGHFGMEIVWINDGSDPISTELLENTLKKFEQNCRFTKVIYKKWDVNMGIGYSLMNGVLLCSNELIIKFDSDDIMYPERIIKQINFMKNNPDCVVCSGNLDYLKVENGKKKIYGQTNHKYLLTWDEYKQNPSHWFMNHACSCYKKSAVLSIGNYDEKTRYFEDFEMQLKLLKKYKKIYTIQENFIHYRMHGGQTTKNNTDPKYAQLRTELINKMIESPDDEL